MAATQSVAPNYTHRDKLCTPGAGVTTSGARLKWYNVAWPETPVPAEIDAMAHALVERLELPGDLGFVVLHRCGDNEFYFLAVTTWRNENELWESVYAKDSKSAGFENFPAPGPHRGTFCVWELGPVVHERLAWRRFLLSSRDEAASQAYLADHFEGAV